MLDTLIKFEIWKFPHVMGSGLFFILLEIDCANSLRLLVLVCKTILDAHLKSLAMTLYTYNNMLIKMNQKV